jgi:hypothetical protein
MQDVKHEKIPQTAALLPPIPDESLDQVLMNEFKQLNRLANKAAAQKMLRVRPQLTAVGSAMSVLGLKNYTLLHAGPPFKDTKSLPKTIQSSIVLSAIYEGWANNELEVLTLLERGLIELKPAQDFRCVTPLAATISPKTSLLCVKDAKSTLPACFAPLASGPGADIRFGTNNPGVLSTLTLRDTLLTRAMMAVLKMPIELFDFALLGLQGGDELHSSTTAATQALSQEIHTRLKQSSFALDQTLVVEELIKSNPGFFLTPWMAACKLMLTSIEAIPFCSFITRLGGNGQSMGLSTSQAPMQWLCQASTAPKGTRFVHAHPTVAIEAAVGDSCVIDAMGFGGQLINASPTVIQSLQPFCPQDYATRSKKIMAMDHDHFNGSILGPTEVAEDMKETKVRCGLDVLRIVELHCNPLINLAMLANDGVSGLLGRGVYELDPVLSAQAATQLHTPDPSHL